MPSPPPPPPPGGPNGPPPSSPGPQFAPTSSSPSSPPPSSPPPPPDRSMPVPGVRPPAPPPSGSSGFGPPPPAPSIGPPSGGSGKRAVVWAAIVVVLALLVGGGLFVALSGDDDSSATDVTDPPATDEPATTATIATIATTVPDSEAPTTSAPASTLAPVVPTLPMLTTIAVDTLPPVGPGDVDLGHGVSFALPEGYTDSPSSTGSSHQLENGTISAFFQVLEREPGESALALLQEYVDTFDTDFDSVVYSQVIPSGTDETGAAPSDGDAIHYRALNADGTGVRGVIEAHRRADGLAFVSDIFRGIDDDSDEIFPEATLDEIYGSYYAAPLLGDIVDLEPSVATRVASAHPSYTIDGLVAITPPPGWNVDTPGPGRVVMSRPDGQRFLGERIGPLTDMGSAQVAGESVVRSLVPDATFGEFSVDADSRWNFTSARWGGTDPNTGQPLQGYISVWFDPATGEAYDALDAWVGPASDPPSLVESDFLFQAMSTSINQPRG